MEGTLSNPGFSYIGDPAVCPPPCPCGTKWSLRMPHGVGLGLWTHCRDPPRFLQLSHGLTPPHIT
eukprot:2375483-Karenia_brevis.AAC.1